jgi:hypothetical protein
MKTSFYEEQEFLCPPSSPNKERIFVLMKKMIQHPKICNEENVPYFNG